MEVTNVLYGRTLNLGNYESEKIELTALIEKNEDVGVVIEELRELITVNSMKIARMVGRTIDSAAETAPTSPVKPLKAKKETKVKEEVLEVVAPKPVVDVVEEEIKESDLPVEHQLPLPQEEVKKEKKPRAAAVKAVKYDNKEEIHKKMMGALLSKYLPEGWNKSVELKERAKTISSKLVGEDFLGKLGEVLPEFEAKVQKLAA